MVYGGSEVIGSPLVFLSYFLANYFLAITLKTSGKKMVGKKIIARPYEISLQCSHDVSDFLAVLVGTLLFFLLNAFTLIYWQFFTP